jgi:hypothetical protein
MVSTSSRASSIVLTSRATDVRRSMSRNVVCSSVVLPDPMSPVITTKPACPSTP